MKPGVRYRSEQEIIFIEYAIMLELAVHRQMEARDRVDCEKIKHDCSTSVTFSNLDNMKIYYALD